MYVSFPPRVVVTLHGIRTRGQWQKGITPYLARYGLIPYHIDYGWVGALSLLLPWSREKQVRLVRDELRSLVERSGADRISVVAHSFGTYLAMEALRRERGAICYDRVVLTGSIVSTDFDWGKMFANKCVIAVRNERVDWDWAVVLCEMFVKMFGRVARLKAGKSGMVGFSNRPAGLLDAEFEGGHSETHNCLKYEQWARFIAYPILPPEVLQKIRREMSVLRNTLAKMLEESNGNNIRINLFGAVGGVLRIIPGAVENMDYAPEFSLAIEQGHGATGFAYETGRQCVVLRDHAGWSGSSLPDEELDKIHPDLKWVISTPIQFNQTKLAVLSVDGLAHIPKVLRDDTEAVLWAILSYTVRRLLPYLNAAYVGRIYKPMEDVS